MPSLLLPLTLATGIAMGEDVADLADRDDCAPRLRGALQEVAVRRRHGEILAMGRADEVLGRLDPTNGRAITRPMFKRIAKPARDAAEIVESLEAERLLVRGDLEHRIGRGVADRLPGPEVLLAKLLDDHGAGGMPSPRMPGSLPSAISASVSVSGNAGIVCGK